MKAAILALAFLASPAASAGGYDLGNGGNVVRCPHRSSAGIFSRGLTVVDLIEGTNQGLTYRKLRSLRGRGLDEAFAIALRSFLAGSPDVKTLFAKWRREDRLELSRSPLPTLRPGPSRLVPAGCRREQAAIQYFSRFRPVRAYRLTLSGPLWNEMTADLKVALLIHEYVARYAALSMSSPAFDKLHAAVAVLLSDQGRTDDSRAWQTVLSERSLFP